MHWQQIVAIAVLSVMLAVLAVAGGILWHTRDRGAHRATSGPSHAALTITERAWTFGPNQMRHWRVIYPRTIAAARPSDGLTASRERVCPPVPPAGPPDHLVTYRALGDPVLATAVADGVRQWYAAREERLTQRLLDAGAARWH